MDEPNPPIQEEERHIQSGELWSQLNAEQQAYVVRLLSQMAYRFFAAQAEVSARKEERENGPSCSE